MITLPTERGSMRSSATIPLALLLVFGNALPALAQGDGFRVEVIPRIGWSAPDRTLRLVPISDPETDGRITNTRTTSGLALGIGAEVPLPIRMLALRADVFYMAGAELDHEWSAGRRPVADGSFLTLAADLVVRPVRFGALAPFAVLGGGFKYYGFDQDGMDPDFLPHFSDDQTAGMVHFGAGFDVSFGRYTLTAEVGDYLSSYPSQPTEFEQDDGSRIGINTRADQHDVLFLAGLRVHLFR